MADQIRHAASGGTALPPAARGRLEGALGTDLEAVRLHTDTNADRLSRDLGARAFTAGTDIFFRQGAYAPESPDGFRLLAHETAHAVQQGGPAPAADPASGLALSQPGDPSEVAADTVADQVMSGDLARSDMTAPPVGLGAGPLVVQREVQPGEEEKAAAPTVGPGAAVVSLALSQQGMVRAKEGGGTPDPGSNKPTRFGWERLDAYFETAYGGRSDGYSGYGIGLQEDVKYFNNKGPAQSWCGIFSLWALKSAGLSVGNWQLGSGIGSVPGVRRTQTPIAGDIIYLDNGNAHHGIFIDFAGANVHSIDGNTAGSDTNGGQIEEKVRPPAAISFYTAQDGAAAGGPEGTPGSPGAGAAAAGALTAAAPPEPVAVPADEPPAVTACAELPAPVEQPRADGPVVAPIAEGIANTGPTEPPPDGAEGAPPPAAAGPTLLMPEPPPGPTAADEERLSTTVSAFGGVASAATRVSSPAASTRAARGAVQTPAQQLQAQGDQAQVAIVDDRPPPDPELEKLCDRVYAILTSKRPTNEKELNELDPQEMAGEAGRELQKGVAGRTAQAGAGYDGLQQPGQPAQAPPATPVEPDAAAIDAPAVSTEAAAPEPVPAETMSLDADVKATDQRMERSGMETEAANAVQSGPIADARAARGELGEAAAADSAAVAARQQEAITGARSDMAALQASARQALEDVRLAHVKATTTTQTGMVGSEEATRAQVGARTQAIVNSARQRVRDLLTPLPERTTRRWEAEIVPLKAQFAKDLKRVEEELDKRHSGIGGALLAAWDWATGWPKWMKDDFEKAQERFASGVTKLIRDLSQDVNAVLRSCKQIIDTSRTQVDELLDSLPEDLRAWAEGQKQELHTSLDGLQGEVAQARQDFHAAMRRSASGVVREVRSQIDALRSKAGGILGRFENAVTTFLENPAKAIFEGLLSLVGIDPSAFWQVVDRLGAVVEAIAADPLKFANTLVSALKLGFQQFFGNFGTHALQGLMDWLFSGLGAVGVQMPTDLSLRSMITLFLQVMGITWDRIRKLLAKHIGEENVELIEQAWEAVSLLIEQGPQGIWEMIQDKLDPQEILSQVMDAAINYLMEALIKQVAARIVAMMNPAGWVAQAAKAIYEVLKWVFENASRIFTLVQTIVDGAYELVQGNISGMANAVEGALGKVIAPVIDFLAGQLGFGDLPQKIAEVIGKLQDWVEGKLDLAMEWVAEKGKKLLAAVGLGGEETPENETAAGPEGEIGERLTFEDEVEHETHTLWIQRDGDNVAVMVASSPSPLKSHLDLFRSLASQAEEPIEDRINAASQLGSEISDLAGLLLQEKDQAKRVQFDICIIYKQKMLAVELSQIMADLGIEVPTADDLEPIEIPFSFNPKAKYSTEHPGGSDAARKEMQDQIDAQIEGLNGMNASEWWENRNAYTTRSDNSVPDGDTEWWRNGGRVRDAVISIQNGVVFENGRDPESDYHQKVARDVWIDQRADEIFSESIANGCIITYDEASIRAEEEARGLAILHNPDQVAGGHVHGLGRMGNSGVNSSIGAQWGRGLAASLQDSVLKQLNNTPRELWVKIKLSYFPLAGSLE
jgi:hypothetical protein